MAHLSDNANHALTALLRPRRQLMALSGAEHRRLSGEITKSDKKTRKVQLAQLCRLLIEAKEELPSMIQTPLRPHEKGGCRKMVQ